MTSCADQWAGSAPIEGNAHARARKYSTTGPSVKLGAPITTALCGNQRQRSIGHNGTVMMRMSQVHYQDQQQHGGAYVAIVMMMITAAWWRIQQHRDQRNWREFSLITGANAQPQQLPQNLHAIASTTGANAQRQQLAGISSRVGSTTDAGACAQQLPGISAGSAPRIGRRSWRCSKAQNQRRLAIAISGADDKEQKPSPLLD